MALHTISICTGSGMLDVGLDVGSCGMFEPVLYVEREAFSVAHLAEKMEKGYLDVAPVWSDVRTVTGAECGEYLRRRCGERGPEAIVGGIPCQPHSVAGKRLGAEDERDLWEPTLEILQKYNSIKCVFIENVSGFVGSGAWDRVRNDLEGLDYRVAAVPLAASDVGANHKRERIFILALAKNATGIGWRGRSDGNSGWGEREIQTEGLCCELVDSSRHDRHRSEREAGGGGRVCETSNELVNPKNSIWGRASNKNVKRRRNSKAGRSGRVQLADRGGERFQGDEYGGAEARTVGRSGRAEIPFFAFGPEDERWGNLLEEFPELAPAVESGVCGVADGNASRVDRLRMLGNGVVPLQAAVAFNMLWADLWDGGGK